MKFLAKTLLLTTVLSTSVANAAMTEQELLTVYRDCVFDQMKDVYEAYNDHSPSAGQVMKTRVRKPLIGKDRLIFEVTEFGGMPNDAIKYRLDLKTGKLKMFDMYTAYINGKARRPSMQYRTETIELPFFNYVVKKENRFTSDGTIVVVDEVVELNPQNFEDQSIVPVMDQDTGKHLTMPNKEKLYFDKGKYGSCVNEKVNEIQFRELALLDELVEYPVANHRRSLMPEQTVAAQPATASAQAPSSIQ